MQATGKIRRVDDLGRIVIPKAVRECLGILRGDRMEFYVDTANGLVMFKKVEREES